MCWYIVVSALFCCLIASTSCLCGHRSVWILRSTVVFTCIIIFVHVPGALCKAIPNHLLAHCQRTSCIEIPSRPLFALWVDMKQLPWARRRCWRCFYSSTSFCFCCYITVSSRSCSCTACSAPKVRGMCFASHHCTAPIPHSFPVSPQLHFSRPHPLPSSCHCLSPPTTGYVTASS